MPCDEKYYTRDPAYVTKSNLQENAIVVEYATRFENVFASLSPNEQHSAAESIRKIIGEHPLYREKNATISEHLDMLEDMRDCFGSCERNPADVFFLRPGKREIHLDILSANKVIHRVENFVQKFLYIAFRINHLPTTNLLFFHNSSIIIIR